MLKAFDTLSPEGTLRIHVGDGCGEQEGKWFVARFLKHPEEIEDPKDPDRCQSEYLHRNGQWHKSTDHPRGVFNGYFPSEEMAMAALRQQY